MRRPSPWVLALLLSAGCATHAHVRQRSALEADVCGLVAGAQAIPSVGVAPVAVSRQAGDYDVDAARLRASLCERLVALGIAREAAPAESEAALEATVRLELDVEEARLRLVRRLHWTNTVFWAVGGGYLSNWVHDHEYEMWLRARLRWSDPRGGDLLLEQELPEVAHREALNFHERTGGAWPYVVENLVPPTFCASQPEALHDHLAPGALLELLRAAWPEATDLAFERRLYRLTRKEAPGVAITMDRPANGGRVLRRSKVDLALKVEATEPGLLIERVDLDGETIWPVNVEEGVQPPPRRVFVLEKEDHPMGEDGVRVDITDSRGVRSWAAVESAAVDGEEVQGPPRAGAGGGP